MNHPTTRISTFQCDITPPIGHPLCAGWYPPAAAISDPLTAHGLILSSEDQAPVVLCALDWAELSNHDYLRWREELAEAVRTEPDRVAVHCVHAHDTPWPDREAQDLLDAHGHPNVILSGDWSESVRAQTARAAKDAMSEMQPCSVITTGIAKVEQIASNRRVMGEDGRVRAVRTTVTRDPEVRAAPIGLIDPMLRAIGFWHDDRKLAGLYYYAVHPTSYDRTGEVTPEFVGLARNRLIADNGGLPHIYFTGCAGNITAGKFNDGNHANREIFTGRILEAMKQADQNARPQTLETWDWHTENINLPPREDLNEAALLARLAGDESEKLKSKAALMLTYLRRWENVSIPVTCLSLNDDTAILNLPGEAFIEYQLYARDLNPDRFVAVASYGDLGTGYITLQKSFQEGGYEPTDAFVSGQAEGILKSAIDQVMA
jgi:hypothetical protein